MEHLDKGGCPDCFGNLIIVDELREYCCDCEYNLKYKPCGVEATAYNMENKIGMEEGDKCNRGWCIGIIRLSTPVNCSCHLGHAPCSPCMSTYLYCPVCGIEQTDEEAWFDEQDKKPEPFIYDEGFWNGEKAAITCCIVKVAMSEKPLYWSNKFAGQLRQGLQIVQGTSKFMIDNEHGSGYEKATVGRGLPSAEHADLHGELIEFLPFDRWNTQNRVATLQAEQAEVEEYQRDTAPEAYEHMRKLREMFAKKDKMSTADMLTDIVKKGAPLLLEKFKNRESKEQYEERLRISKQQAEESDMKHERKVKAAIGRRKKKRK